MLSGTETEWKMSFAPNIGLNSLDTPQFLHSVGSLDPLEHIAFIGDRGFAGIEDNFLKLRSSAEQSRMGEALQKRGMRMGCFVANPASWDQPLWVSSGSDAREKLKSDLDSSIDAAKRTGGRVMTVLTGSKTDVPREYQVAAMIDNLRRLAPQAQEAGVVLGLEACNSLEYPMLFLNDVRETFLIADAVDSPAVGIVFDIYHVQIMTGDVIRNLQRCSSRIAAVQLADNPGRAEPGTGEVSWPHVLRAVRDMNYAGLVELEHEILGAGLDGERTALERLRTINETI